MTFDKKEVATYEIYLTILVTAAFLTAAILEFTEALRGTYFSWFLIFLGTFLILEKNIRPRPKPTLRDIPLGSFVGNYNVRFKNRLTGKVLITFQWPERPDSGYVHQRIGVRTSALVSEYFSHLTAPPTHAELRNYLQDSLRDEVRSLKLTSFEVLIHDIEIKEPPRDDNNPDVIVGVVIR